MVCQQGLQFFADIGAAAREFARVARPGARVAATVWAPVERNPLLHAQLRAIEAIAPDARGSFLQATSCSASEIVDAFTAGGWRDANDSELTFTITLPDVDAFVPGQFAALPWAAQLNAARDDGLAAASAMVLAAITGDVTEAREVTLPFSVAMVTATR